jgi:hypothetical protein
MSELKIKGRITKKLEVESGTSKAGKEWKKQSFVIDNGNQYNPEVCFSCFGDDKLDMLSSHKEGSEVEVYFNVSSREFNGKYYHNLDAWNIKGSTPANPELNKSDTEDDDLPF